LVSQIETYTNLSILPDFSSNLEFKAAKTEAENKLALVREKIKENNDLINNVNA